MRTTGKAVLSWVAVIAVAGAVAGAVGLAQRQDERGVPTTRDARDLSTVFRRVASEALPSIVSIETEGRAIQRRGRGFEDGMPFEDLFRNHPEFREFFRERQFRMPRTHGMGSGFIIDASGTIMTNSHVVRDAQKVTVRLQDGREFVATDVKMDPRSDVATIHIDAPEGLKAIRLGDSNAMEIGDWVLAIGSPFGLDMSVTAGIISAKGRGPGIADREDFLQTDAAINPGNSGGPLLNLNGEVIGINTAISSSSGGYDGVGFAIPINMAKWVSQQLVQNGSVKRAYIGVGVREVNNEIAKLFHAKVGQGAVVNLVTPNSPAAEAQLQPGDVILEFDGQAVNGPRGLQGIVEKLQVGKTYRARIIRDGKKRNIEITVSEMPEDLTSASLSTPGQRGPSAKNMYEDLGIQVEPISNDVAESLGVKTDGGVLVSAVEAGSPAQIAGLEAGDVVEKVGASRVRNVDEFREAVKEASLADGILLIVRNANGTRFVNMKPVNEE